MKKSILLAFILFAGMSLVHAAVSGNYLSEIPEFSKAYNPARNPFQDGRDALELARKTGRLVMIEVGGDWCIWCHVLDRFIKENKDVYDTLHANYVVLKVNMSDENDNKEFLSGLPKTNGYPHLFITRDDGTVIYSTDMTRLVENGKYVHERVMVFLEHWLDE
jgi:thiol:disulfide interchange protein